MPLRLAFSLARSSSFVMRSLSLMLAGMACVTRTGGAYDGAGAGWRRMDVCAVIVLVVCVRVMVTHSIWPSLLLNKRPSRGTNAGTSLA